MKRIYVIAGGTVVHIRPHFAVCAPAYGTVGLEITDRLHKLLWATEETETDCMSLLVSLVDEAPEPVNKYGIQVVPLFTRMAQGHHPRTGGYEGRQTIEAAGLKHVETNEDLSKLVDYLIAQPDTRGIVMAAAVCDWVPAYMSQDVVEVNKSVTVVSQDEFGNMIHEHPHTYISLQGDFLRDEFGKDKPRLSSRLEGHPNYRKGVDVRFKAADKLIGRIRRDRKDIFLVSFKTTAGVTQEETYAAGLKSLKGSSSNLVLANDVQNHHNVIVTPEEYPYYAETREKALDELAQMILDRVQLDFVRTKVIAGDRADLVALDQEGAIPNNFLPVLRHLLDRGAYKPLPWADKTSGHFGCVVEGKDYKRVSSVRKVNHNRVLEEGAAKIVSDEGDHILAVGAKPSVGEHTQRMIYEEIKNGDWSPSLLGEAHSIVHFHCPKHVTTPVSGPRFDISERPQKQFECGSVQCGTNTATGMKMLEPGIWAVHLSGHGPIIAWHRDVDPERVIRIIENHWNLDRKSGGDLG